MLVPTASFTARSTASLAAVVDVEDAASGPTSSSFLENNPRSVARRGFEPLTSSLKGKRSREAA